MSIEGRIARLEARRNTAESGTGARERLMERLDRLAQSVRESGDTAHRPGASVMENLVRAWLRGDAKASGAIWQDILARVRR